MKNKKKLRRLKYLIGEVGGLPMGIESLDTHRRIIADNHISKYYRTENWIEIFKLATELKLDDNDLLKIWSKTYFEKRIRRNEYKKKPIKRHVENPNMYAGEEWKLIGGGTKRKPRRARKTAWKRFYKLFPEAKEQQVHKKPSGRVYR
jgi:hypothetical protein